MLVYLASFLSAVSAISIGRVYIVYPSIETSRSGEKIIKFRALDQNIYLRLEPAGEVIAHDFIMVNGANEEIKDSINIGSIKRKFYTDEKTGAALYVDDDGSLILNGIINSELSIEPHRPKTSSNDGRIAHSIKKMQKPENDYFIDISINEDFNGNLNETNRQLTDNDCIRIEVAFITDSKFTERFNNTLELLAYLANMLSWVELKFRSLELGIKFVPIGVMKITKENEITEAPYINSSLSSEYPGSLDGDQIINTLRHYYCNKEIALFKRADLVLFMSGRQFVSKREDGTVGPGLLGRAFKGSICNLCLKYSIIQDTSNNILQVSLVATHEIGHILGSVHDGEGPDPYIPKNPGAIDCSGKKAYIMKTYYDEKAIMFSQCSLENIKSFLKLESAKCVIENCNADEKRIIAKFL